MIHPIKLSVCLPPPSPSLLSIPPPPSSSTDSDGVVTRARLSYRCRRCRLRFFLLSSHMTAACVAVQDQNGDGELDTAECVNHFVEGTPAQRSAQAQKVSHAQQRQQPYFIGLAAAASYSALPRVRCHVFAAATCLPQDCAPAARLPHTEGHPPADRPGAPDKTSTPPPPTTHPPPDCLPVKTISRVALSSDR